MSTDVSDQLEDYKKYVSLSKQYSLMLNSEYNMTTVMKFYWIVVHISNEFNMLIFRNDLCRHFHDTLGEF